VIVLTLQFEVLAVCAFPSSHISYLFFVPSWLKKVVFDYDANTVDLSNVIAANGRHFVLNGNRCGLCGLRNGLKTKCADGRCHAHGEKNKPYHFHATCARQIGFEVANDKDDEFAGKLT